MVLLLKGDDTLGMNTEINHTGQLYRIFHREGIKWPHTKGGCLIWVTATAVLTVLGPLFLLYVNDVAENMVSVCSLYADDISLQQWSDNINKYEMIGKNNGR